MFLETSILTHQTTTWRNGWEVHNMIPHCYESLRAEGIDCFSFQSFITFDYSTSTLRWCLCTEKFSYPDSHRIGQVSNYRIFWIIRYWVLIGNFLLLVLYSWDVQLIREVFHLDILHLLVLGHQATLLCFSGVCVAKEVDGVGEKESGIPRQLM
jgi:hypothetical protein